MKSKSRHPVSREGIVYFRNGTRQEGDGSLEAERPLWLIELEAMVPELPAVEQPVVYYRDGGKARRRPAGPKRRPRKPRS